MFRITCIIGLFLIIVPTTRAQDPDLFSRVNGETYRLYLAEEWDSLLTVGEEGLQNNIDFYYLRMRMGIARYRQKNYRRAIHHFERALAFNQDDPVALEYLYFAMILSGQQEAASQVRKQFRGDLSLKLPAPKGKFAERFSANYLYWLGSKDAKLEVGDITIPGVQYVARYFHNASLSLVNRISPGVSLVHSLNFLSKTNEYISYDGVTGFYSLEQHVNQLQYYISPRLATASGLIFKPMLHLIGIQYQAGVDQGTGFQGGNTPYSLEYFEETDFATGFELQKELGMVDLYFGAAYGALNQAHQVQNRMGVTWFPLGNLNLYTGGFLNTQVETDSGGKGVVRLIPEWLIGFAISEKIWIDLNAAMGEMTNYLENNGQVVYNSFSEVIEKKVTLSVSVPVTKTGSILFAGGRWTANRSEFHPFEPASSDFINPIKYNAFSIYGGLSWMF